MIKKILFAFFFGLITINSYALNIHVVGEWASKVLAKFIPNEETRSDVVDVYNEELEKNKGTLSVESVVKISDAAGWENFKEKRKEFVQALLVVGKAGAEYRARYGYEVCGDEKGKSGGIERCVDDVFDGLFRGINVTRLQAEGLCKEYALVKYNDDIECDSLYRTEGNDDYIRCTSKTNSIDNSKESIYYEFKFDDIKESVDSAITEGVIKSICKIHDVKVRDITLCMTKDENLCSKINDSMKKFGYSAKVESAGSGPSWGYYCVVNTHPMSEKDLRTAFGINNRAFETGYQLSAYPEIRNKLCEYIEQNADTTITSCECNYNRNYVTIVSGGFDNHADVLTCYADGQPIDFVFDDLSEHDKKISSGNMEAFNCSVLGGEYQGKTCYTPDKELCDKIAEATLLECPECKKAYWDEKANACVLPNATEAIQHQKIVNLALIAGGAAVNVGLTLYFGGSNWAYFVLVTDTLLTGMEFGGQIHIDGVADTFFTKANNCNNATCAEEILKEYFMYLARMTNDLQDAELKGVDAKFEKFVEMLPEDSQFLVDLYISGCYTPEDDNLDISKCDDGKWNTDQIIRAIGIAGQLFTLVGAGVKAVVGAERIATAASKTPRLTKVLTKRIPGVKARITQKLAKGEKVLRSDGKTIKALGATKADDAVKSATKTTTATKADDAAKGMTKVTATTKADDAAKSATKTTAVTKADDIATISKKLGNNFDDAIKDIKNGKRESISLLKEQLTDSEWKVLKENLSKEGLEMVELPGSSASYGMEQVVIAKKGANISGFFGGTTKSVTKADDATKSAAKTTVATKSDDATTAGRVVAQAEDKVRFGRLDFDVVVDKDSGVKYYEYAYGSGVSKESTYEAINANEWAKSITGSYGKKTFVFKRGDKNIIAVFDSVDDFNATRFSAEEKRWLELYEKHAAGNETFDHFKAGYLQNDLAEAERRFANFDGEQIIAESKVIAEEANKAASDLFDKFVEKHRFDKYNEYVDIRNANKGKGRLTPKTSGLEKWTQQEIDEAQNLYDAVEKNVAASDLFDKFAEKHRFDKYNEYVGIRNANKGEGRLTPKTSGLEKWTQQEIDEAQNLYDAVEKNAEAREAFDDAVAIGKTGIDHSTLDSYATSLKHELKDPDLSSAVYGELDKYQFNQFNRSGALTDDEYKTIKAFVEDKKYDEDKLLAAFNKDPEVVGISNRAKDRYKNFLQTKSSNVNRIDGNFGITKEVVDGTGRFKLIAKNEFVQKFVSKRVSVYEDIITKNPSIYNRAKTWNQLSLEEREKLCKEIFEIADDKFGLKHTDFGVRDLVKDFGKSIDTEGLQRQGNVYISSRHFPNMSFGDVMETLAHEQAHKIDQLNPNAGILGSQLSDLGSSRGYIQGYAGSSYQDYRRELTEQSSWLIGEEMKKAISKLGL